MDIHTNGKERQERPEPLVEQKFDPVLSQLENLHGRVKRKENPPQHECIEHRQRDRHHHCRLRLVLRVPSEGLVFALESVTWCVYMLQ